jgi:predicted O-linked N-acetylglucosamine transferase (SPINDLY family)
MKGGRGGEAVESLREAVALQPGQAMFHNNLGVGLKMIGRIEEAIGAVERAISLAPDYADAYSNLGNLLQIRGRPDDAIAACREALRLNPNHPDAWNNLGNALQVRWKLEEAAAAYREALRLRPGMPETWNNLGNAVKSQGRLDEALDCYRRALALRPSYAEAHSSLVYAQLYHPDYDEIRLRDELRAWDRQHAAPLKQFWEGHPNDRDPERRLRIGYVSPDYRGHAMVLFMIPLEEAHNRRAVEFFCYSDVHATDVLTEQVRERADHWRNIAGLADERVAEMVRADKIDILVDLTVHMARNRLRLFARRPAPVQVTWLGYPGSTGLDAIDYRFTDPHLDPPPPGGRPLPRGAVYAEETVWLPETFWCYHPLAARDDPAVNPLPTLSRGHVTFGCLNNFCKINDGVLALWARVMARVPGSRLLLLAGEGNHREQTQEKLEALGVRGARERVEFSSYVPRAEYLRKYREIDLGLETFPYNGHTTSLDSYWMGVPVVTLVGRTIVGRAGLSQLMNLGLPELIARSEEEYITVAATLAHDLPRLAGLRATLRDRMERSPLMGPKGFAGNMEALYRDLWRRYCSA